MSRRHARHVRRTPARRPRLPSPTSLVGLAAVVTAAVGATGVGQHEVASVATPAVAAEHRPAMRSQHALAVRRAQVMEATRSHTRDPVDLDVSAGQAAKRGAAVRARSLNRLGEAAADRSADIARQRLLARQRRIERRNSWVAPVSDYDITATFGSGGGLWSSSHTGLDFAAAEGSPVGSAAAGEVTFAGYDGAFGNKVVVTHDEGTKTWYCHLDSIAVESGESVGPGTTVGTLGSSGNTTGPHLHLEVHRGGTAVDPYAYLQEQNAL